MAGFAIYHGLYVYLQTRRQVVNATTMTDEPVNIEDDDIKDNIRGIMTLHRCDVCDIVQHRKQRGEETGTLPLFLFSLHKDI